jgi:hypothetical protein
MATSLVAKLEECAKRTGFHDSLSALAAQFIVDTSRDIEAQECIARLLVTHGWVCTPPAVEMRMGKDGK